MKLISVSAKNFLSLGDVSLDFSAYDGFPVVFTGGNGHGKSSIFEAVIYALTGKTNRGLRGSSIVKRGKSSYTVVDCLFETPQGLLQVLRYRNDRRYKNSLRVLLEGSEVTKGTSELTQKFLYNLIGFTESSLMASILFGQNASGVSSFSDVHLKNLVEAILGIMDYQRAQVEAKQEYQAFKAELTSLSEQKTFLQEEIASMEELLVKENKKHDDSVKATEEEINSLKSTSKVIEILKSVAALNYYLNAKKIKDLTLKIKSINFEYQKSTKQLTRLKSESHGYDKDINKANKLISLGTCPTCHQKITSGHSHLDDIIKESKENKKIVSEKIEECEALSKKFSDKEKHFEEKLKKLRLKEINLSDQKFNFKSSLDEINWNIKSLKNELLKTSPDLENLNKRIEKYKFKVYSISVKTKKTERLLEEASFWVEGFGPSGLRNHLVHTILPGLNAKIKEYLHELSDGSITAEIDSQITKKGKVRFDKLKTRLWINNQEVELNSCSGGERRKVDIALGLALGDISGIQTLLFDEWFTDLDSAAMDSAFKILDRLCVNRRVLIATHHERFTESHIVNKVGGTTTIREVK